MRFLARGTRLCSRMQAYHIRLKDDLSCLVQELPLCLWLGDDTSFRLDARELPDERVAKNIWTIPRTCAEHVHYAGTRLKATVTGDAICDGERSFSSTHPFSSRIQPACIRRDLQLLSDAIPCAQDRVCSRMQSHRICLKDNSFCSAMFHAGNPYLFLAR